MSSEMSNEVNNADALIAEALVASGFNWKPAYSPTFEGQLTVSGVTFKLQISDVDTTFLKLPTVKLLEKPKELEGTLPHIFSGGQLCYLERLGIFLDPLEPGRTTLVIIEAIKRLLGSFLDPQATVKDFGNEIWAYWNASDFCYLTTNQRISIANIYQRKDLSGNIKFEYAIGENEESLALWRAKRNELDNKNLTTGKAIVLDLDTIPSVDLSKNWPPKTWKEFITWLYEKHPAIEQKLLSDLQKILPSQSSIVVVLNSRSSGPIGIFVSFNSIVKEISNRITNKTRKKRKTKNSSNFRQRLSSNKLVNNFSRLFVVDATPEFIIERNLQTASLKNSKIAIIGCGTVGSFAAKLLVMAGAGTGQEGLLSLYDDDYLSSANIGRHLLDIEYLGENKSKALTHLLCSTSTNDLSIKSHGKYIVTDANKLTKYDLVIDATGDETFSTLLSLSYHKSLKNISDKPTLIHSWLDANGHALRAIIDDRTGACYRCLKEPVIGSATGELKQRYPLFKKDIDEDNLPPIKHRCGESYIPFSAGASFRLAGMLQQMVLDVFHGAPSPRFRHQSLSETIRTTKNQNPSRRENCPCCVQ